MADPLLIAGPNRALASATITPSFSGGSWLAAMPLANLSDMSFAKVARSSDAALASTTFDLDMGAARAIKLVGIPESNVSLAGLVRYRLATDSGFTDVVHDSGWLDYWPVIYPMGSVPISDPHWLTGRLTAEERAGYPAMHLRIIEGAAVTARYLRVEIDDTTNAAGYVQLAALFVAPAVQFDKSMRLGWQLGWQAQDTRRVRSLGGGDFFDARAPRRVVTLEVPPQPQDAMLAGLFELQRAQGRDKAVLVVLDPAATANLARLAFLARFRELSALEFVSHDRAAVGLALEEQIQ
jgi:hypothetical protein